MTPEEHAEVLMICHDERRLRELAKEGTMDDIDYKAWAIDLCSLLDEIEAALDDEEKLDELVHYRHQIARNHGMIVKIVGAGEVGHG